MQKGFIGLIASLVIVLAAAGIACGAYYLAHRNASFSIPGMSKYTDPSFGFSFWYPSSWTVVETPSSDPGAYVGGTIEKTLSVDPGPNAQNYEGLAIEEYHSDGMTITIPSDDCPAGDAANNCPAQQIYFDTVNRTWMVAYPQGDYNGNSGTKTVADISDNTMGGLHIINGLTRFNATGVIPLSAENFLVITSFDGSVTEDPLTDTIMATNPAVATSASTAQQKQIVYKEALIDGAVGTSTGSWYIDGQHVYDSQLTIVPGANPSTFHPITRNSDGTTIPFISAWFGTDGVHVWYDGDGPAVLLEGADPATFVLIVRPHQNSAEPPYEYETSYEKDKSHVWDGDQLVPGADPNTFVTLEDEQSTANGGITLAHDAYHTYGEDNKGNVTVDGVTVQH